MADKINDLVLVAAALGNMQLETDTGGVTAGKVTVDQISTKVLLDMATNTGTLADGWLGTTQPFGDSSLKLATTGFVEGHHPHNAYGFVTRSDNTIDYTIGTFPTPIAIAIQPTGVSFDYFIAGVKFSSTGRTIQQTATTGVYYFYIDSTDTLHIDQTIPGPLVTTYIGQAVFDNAPASGVRTGFVIDKRYVHSDSSVTRDQINTRGGGAYAYSGFDMTSFDEKPAVPADADNAFGLDSGVIKDNDIKTNLAALTAGVGPYFPFERGASSEWHFGATSTLPYELSAGIFTYNQNMGGGNWQLTQVGDTRFANWYYIGVPIDAGTTGDEYRILCIPGQKDYATEKEALAENFADLDLTGGFPPTFAPLYKITWGRSVGYGTTGQVRIEKVVDLRSLNSLDVTAPKYYDTQPIEIISSGDKDTDGSYRFLPGTNNLTLQERVGGSWTATPSLTLADAGLTVGTSVPFSDAAGVLTLQNIDALDATTATTIKAITTAGLEWQDSVKDELDFTAAEPAGPSTGDRYINTATGVGSVTAQAVTANYIYEWNGATWTETIPNEGFACWIDDVDTNKVFNGSAWVPFGNTVTHNNLASLQGGTSAEYYHLTSAQHTSVTGLTAAEYTQLAAIDAVTISGTQWGYLGASNQGGATSDTVAFAQVTVDNLVFNGNTISSTTGDINIEADVQDDVVLRVNGNSSQLKLVRETTTTNGIEIGAKVRHETSGSPTVGMGVSLELEAEIRTNTFRSGAQLQASFSNVTGGAEVSKYLVNTYQAGSLTESFNFDGSTKTFNVMGCLAVSLPCGLATYGSAYTTGSGLSSTPAGVGITLTEDVDLAGIWVVNSPAAGNMTYSGETRRFSVIISGNISTASGGPSTIQLNLQKQVGAGGWVNIAGSEVDRYLSGTVDTGSFSLQGVVSMSSADDLRLLITSSSDTPTYTFNHLHFLVSAWV